MSTLVNVVNQKMYVSSTMESIVAGSQQFVKFRFNLSDEWDGLLIFAQFRQNGVAYNQYLDEENSVYLPAEIGSGACTLMLYGSKDKVIGTTNYLTLKIDENIFVSDASSTDISESLYTQLVSKVDKLSEKIVDLNNDLSSQDKRITDLEKGGGGSGADGKSAYQIALDNGFVGTETEWLASLKGQDGYTPQKGIDYFDGEKGEKGDKGDKGDKGNDGYTPKKGTDYWTAADKAEMVAEVLANFTDVAEVAL